ncbi:ferrous iron transport protein B [Vibrio astriarenae]|nr:ferrous iron transport protein B [Vibrio sp. C7]
MNNLYTSAEGEDEAFDLMASLEEAVMSIPDNLMGLSYSDPLGIEVGDLSDTAAVAEEQDVDTSIFANIKQQFVSGHAAFAYLIFILLYTPCVAAMGAYVKEFGAMFARFIAVWTMALAYFGAAFYYQAAHFSDHPVTSAVWMVAIIAAYVLTFGIFKRKGKQRDAMELQNA